MSHVYIIATLVDGKPSAPIKIGIADFPSKRLRTLKTASPNPIGIVMFFGPMSREQAVQVEKMCHEAGHRFRRHGEWFDLDPLIGMDVVAAATNLVCINLAWDEVQYAKRSTALGLAAAQMHREPS